MLKRTLDWHPALAEAIRELDGPRFAPALARALRQVAPFDHNVVFGYRGEDRPLDLHDDFGPQKRDIFVSMYQAGPYLLDPFFHASRNNVAPGLYRMRDLAPDRFYQSEYYRSYYVQTGLTEEILATLDDVVEIPVWGLPYSYNVASAATMAMYEYCRQYPEG